MKPLPADEILLTKDNNVKVFGLLWDKARDVVNVSKVDKASTNSILTHLVSTPVTYHGKVFLQELWKIDKLL